MHLWVIGAGGLLGRAVTSHAATRGETFISPPIPWADANQSLEVLRRAAREFAHKAHTDPWAIVWAAGAATVATDSEQAEHELTVFRQALDAVRHFPPAGPGSFLLASSAGGIYAGSSQAPFTSTTEPVPVGTYGRLKLAQERAATAALTDTCPVVIARITNLYGPGQNLAKLQGLVSRLAWSAATQTPVNIFVPLDTIRDYIERDDAARACLLSLERASAPHTVEVIASGRPVTVGQLIRLVGQVSRRRVPVALGTHTSSSDQVLDLRFEPSISISDATTLPEGIKRVYLDILTRLQTGDRSATA